MSDFFNGKKLHKVKDQHLLSFTKSMYYLTKGKVELLDSLNLVSMNYSREFKEKIIQTKKLIEKGKPLNKAFEKIVLDREFLELIKIGEETGNLETVFRNLYEKYKFKEKIRKDITGLSIYPVTVIVTAIIIVTILLKFVVPKFVTVYSDTGQQLPFITRVTVKFSEFFNKYGSIMTGLSIFSVWIIVSLKKRNKRKFEKILLNIPISGKIYKDIRTLNFTGNMYFLTSAGIPLLQSLKMCVNSDSCLLNSEVKKIVTKIEKGENIRKSFHNLSFFNHEYINFLNIGEKTGEISNAFFNLYEIYYEKVTEKVHMFLKIFEPLSIIFIAVIIGLIMLSVMLPVFKMGEIL